ncbi:hypothetical protein PGJ_00019590 [Porphyromonas gingivalis AJW4]|uniref:Lipoprotein n=3 Tax=Porphyromonas gingivalis TaxID=837 RepID=B2RH28_PORG3|nr:hypothetical protein PGJ_00019590 [Porphyromonas gingivalis AJW4]ALJ24640.1 hypothetical protein PGF_00001530 [Porphyromonas gingivalis 381]ATS04195.1 hypothetical protein CS374_03810 [Porphyromonas gingivalis]AUR50353.1 lipoprotein [Porphyromonas gingivalis ATCC 33277]ERJ82363.1 hypothetical protein HMPREF1988_01675 [Porphyromonas gingivalis F0185]ETA27154.1 hypothetical protein SJDPG2_04535 [Porphyromonas gingivalis SJD2]
MEFWFIFAGTFTKKRTNMRMMKLTAMMLALLSALAFSSCKKDEPTTLEKTQWERMLTGAEINKIIALMDGEIDADSQLPESAKLKLELDFFSQTDANLNVDIMITPGITIKMKMKMPYMYNASTKSVLLRLSKSQVLSVEPMFPAFEDIDLSEAEDVTGVVDWKNKTMKLTMQGENHPVHIELTQK